MYGAVPPPPRHAFLAYAFTISLFIYLHFYFLCIFQTVYLFNPSLTLSLFLYLFPFFVLFCLRSFSLFSSLALSVSFLVISTCLIRCPTTSCIKTFNDIVFSYKIITRTQHRSWYARVFGAVTVGVWTQASYYTPQWQPLCDRGHVVWWCPRYLTGSRTRYNPLAPRCLSGLLIYVAAGIAQAI